MQKLGAITALVAGILGTAAAYFVWLFLRALDAAGEDLAVATEDSGTFTFAMLGYGGIFFSFATAVLGAFAIGAKGRVPSVLLIMCAILGIIVGPALVKVCMALALVGGIFATLGAGR